MKLKPIEDSLFKNLPEDLKLNLLRSGVVVVPDVIMPLWTLPEGTRTVILIGGRGGMKTHNVSNWIANNVAAYKKRCIIVRDEKTHVKESILNEILERFEEILWDKSDVINMKTGLKCKTTDKDLVFTKGFKASDNKKQANLKGASNIDIAVIEEAQDITDEDKFNKFTDSLRKEGCVIVIILNTPDIGHFILKRYFTMNRSVEIPENCPQEMREEYEQFYEVDPKNIPGFVCIKSGYKDNRWLPKFIIDEYEGKGDPDSHLFNPHYYLGEIMGYASTGRKGQVHKKVKPINLTDYMALPFKEFYGQDFGTAAPAGLVGVKFNGNNSYCRQINYLPMNTLEIGKLYCTLKLNNSDRIVADNADEKAWKKLRRGFTIDELDKEILERYPDLIRGFNVVPCVKGQDSIRTGIDLMDSMNTFAVTESLDLWNEIRNRIYAQDKNGNYTNEPEPGFDHLLDGWMYVVNDQRGKKKFQLTTE